MAKKSRNKKSQTSSVLAIDIGGTKIAISAVSNRGKILEEVRSPIDLSGGPDVMVSQIAKLADPLIKKYKIKKGAVASAGPLDPVHGTLLNPTNLKGKVGGHWGKIFLIKKLQKKVGIPLKLENDAAAALLAERWVGGAAKYKDFAVVTLGTGLGVAIQVNGRLVRSGQHLHTEMGHILMDLSESAPLCGCGNRGCAEALISGVHFTDRIRKEWDLPSLTGRELVTLAQNGDDRAVLAFRQYARELARFLCSLIVVFSPKLIILSGGFSNSYELFTADLQRKLADLLATRRAGIDLMPEIRISRFRDGAGMIGAAAVAYGHE